MNHVAALVITLPNALAISVLVMALSLPATGAVEPAAAEAMPPGALQPGARQEAQFALITALQAQLPELPPFTWQGASPPLTGRELAPGLQVVAGSSATVLHLAALSVPPPEPELELLVALAGGNYHEALFRLELGDAALAAAACQFVQPLAAGRPAAEASAVPAIGTPLRVEVLHEADPLVHPGVWQRLDASCLLRDVATGRQLPPLPFIYTGSHMVEYEREIGGKRETVRFFALASGRRGWANIYDDSGALLASPLPLAGDDLATIPEPTTRLPPGQPVTIILGPASLPLTLRVDATGALALPAAAVETALRQAFAQVDGRTLRAVALAVPAAIDDDGLLAARASFLRAAVAAQVWAVPVFTWQSGAAGAQ